MSWLSDKCRVSFGGTTAIAREILNLSQGIRTLFNDLTRDSIANNFVIGVHCRCLHILDQIAFFYRI